MLRVARLFRFILNKKLALDQQAEEALAQIKAKGYAQPYLQPGKVVKAVGIRFSSKHKQVDAGVEEVLR